MTCMIDFQVGQRVELSPVAELWMRGARFGDVLSVGRAYVTVKLDRLGKAVKIRPEYLTVIDGPYILRNNDTHREVARYSTRDAAWEHTNRFPQDYIAR